MNEKLYDNPHSIEWVINESNGNNKLECLLRNNAETLQGLCVTVTKEE